MDTQDAIRLSPSEGLTLRYIAEGEFHPTALDWVATQRLKQAGLVEDRRASQPRAGVPCSGS
jgi:hypothetical protein